MLTSILSCNSLVFSTFIHVAHYSTMGSNYTAPVIVMCSQTSKKYSVKVCDLSREDGNQLTDEYLSKGAELIWRYEGKDWPVKFVQWKEKGTI